MKSIKNLGPEGPALVIPRRGFVLLGWIIQIEIGIAIEIEII